MIEGGIKLKILHIYNFYRSNLGYVENFLPIEEAKRGCKIVCLIPEDSNIADNDEYALPNNDLDMWNLMYCNGKPLYIKSNLVKMILLLIRLRPDIITVSYINRALIPLILLKCILNYKIIATIGMPNIISELTWLDRLLYIIFLKLSSIIFERNVDMFIEATPGNVFRNLNQFGIDRSKIGYLPLGSDINIFKQNESARALMRSKLGIGPNEVVFVYAGKLLPGKGIRDLAKAFTIVVKNVSNVRLILVGNGSSSYILKIKDIIRENCIQEYVTFVDFAPHDELPYYYNMADIGIWPGSPSITIQEAMACGLPIIIKKSLQTIHLLKYGNGFPFNTVNELSYYMIDLARNKGKREEMGRLSRELTENEINWQNIGNSAISLYRSLLLTKGNDFRFWIEFSSYSEDHV